MPCLSGVQLLLSAICHKERRHGWASTSLSGLITNLFIEHCLRLRKRSRMAMDARGMRQLASEATSLMAHAAATASVSISKSTKSRDKYQLRILSPLMGELWATHNALQDGVLGLDETITKRLPVLIKQLEAICKVNTRSEACFQE